MPRMRALPLSLSVVVLLLPAPFTSAQDRPTRLPITAADIEQSLGTDWYGVYFKGKKIGYYSSTRELVGKGEDAVYRSTMRISMKLTSLGQKAEMHVAEALEFDTKAPHRLRRAEMTQDAGKVKQVIKVTATPKGFEVAITTGQDTTTRQIAALDYTLADSLTTEVWLRRGPKVGDTITVRDFDVEEVQLDATTNKVTAVKTSLVKGVRVTFYEVDSFSHKLKLSMPSRYDAKGELLSGTLGDLFEVRRETQEQAKNTEFSEDVFVLGQAKVDKALGDLRQVKNLVLEIADREGGFIPSGLCQQLVKGESGNYVCRLGTKHGKPVKATAKEIEENLQETTAYPISNPKVKALVKEALGDAATPQEKVKRLVKFVHDFIRPSLAVHLPKLQDLLERKAGDCKAYALLLTTLARAAGLPAREVSGLMYMGDDTKAFGGHAWNEVVLDGHWVPVDASLNEPEVNATHISFGTNQDATKSLIHSLGKLAFRLIEVERGQ